MSPFLTRQTKDVEGIEREEKNARNVVVDKIENIYVEQRKEEILEEKIWCGRSVGTTQESNNNESRNKGLLVSVEENQKQRFVCFDVTENQKAKDWHEGSQDVLGKLPPVIGVIKIDLLGLYKFVDDLGGYMNVSLDNKWNEIAKLLGLAQENQEAVKECYKEYIGMAKRYYEGATRTKQEKPEDVDDAKVEGSNSVWTTDNNGEEYTSSFIEDIKASRTKKLRKEDFGITTLGRNCWTD
ncbi:bulb-type lectin domain-containing protein [Tanacetum coccineum]